MKERDFETAVSTASRPMQSCNHWRAHCSDSISRRHSDGYIKTSRLIVSTGAGCRIRWMYSLTVGISTP